MKTRETVTAILVALLVVQLTIPFVVGKVKADIAETGSSWIDYPGNHWLDFNETVGSVTCGNSTVFHLQDLTLEAWIKPNSTVESGSDLLHYHHQFGAIVSCRSEGTGWLGWWLGFDYSRGELLFYFTIGSGTFYKFYSSQTVWYNTSWYHIACTYNRTNYNNVKLFVNGTLDSQGNATEAIYYDTQSPSKLVIGAQVPIPPAYTETTQFGGFVDEVRIWNISRTQGEIQGAMERTLNTTETTDRNLIGYWRFDEGPSSDTSHDYSVYHNDAILTLSPFVPSIPPATNTNPNEFISTLGFVINADNLILILFEMWITGLTLMLGKICFGSIIGLFFSSQKAVFEGETVEQYRKRAGQAYKIMGSFFAGLAMLALWIFFPANSPIAYTGIVTGVAFFMALWLFQVNIRNNESRCYKSLKNRVLGVAGIVFAALFTIEFVPALYLYLVPMTAHLGLLYSSGWWSVLLATLSIAGLILTILMTLRLYDRSLVLTIRGCTGETYTGSSYGKVHIDYRGQPFGRGEIRGDSDLARCTICGKNVKMQGGGYYCPNCFYTVCMVDVQKNPMTAWQLKCPKCQTPLLEIADAYDKNFGDF